MHVRRSGPVTRLRRSTPRFRWLAIPLGLVAALVYQGAMAGQLQLTWIDNSEGLAAFRIERKADNAAYTELALESPGITEYTDSTTLEGITYCYRIQAYNDTGWSSYSNEACGSSGTSAGLVLTVSVNGTGQGKVSSNPAGISCGTDCVETYPSSTTVTLSAVAGVGSTFSGWSGGGCGGTDPCTLMGNSPVTVSATFAPASVSDSYPLSVTRSGPGTVASGPTGIDCGRDCSETYVSGTTVTLTATPAKNATFIGWGGACSGTGTCSVVLGEATSVSAMFKGGGPR